MNGFELQIKQSMEIFKQEGIVLEKGLTKQELEFVEKCYGVIFPLDYKALLCECLPLSEELGFTNWRDFSDENIEKIKSKMFDWTIEGIFYTIEKFTSWLPEWGDCPASKEKRVEVASRKIREKPLFLPICGNRFLCINKSVSGCPVYSIHQGIDVICYGRDIWDFLEINFVSYDTQKVDLMAIQEPIAHYNKFVYHSMNNFFYNGARCFDEHGRYIV